MSIDVHTVLDSLQTPSEDSRALSLARFIGESAMVIAGTVLAAVGIIVVNEVFAGVAVSSVVSATIAWAMALPVVLQLVWYANCTVRFFGGGSYAGRTAYRVSAAVWLLVGYPPHVLGVI